MISRDEEAEDGVIDDCTKCALPFPVPLSRLNGATSPFEAWDGDGALTLLGFAISIRHCLSACTVANVMINRTNAQEQTASTHSMGK
jgi:hypothetical protein